MSGHPLVPVLLSTATPLLLYSCGIIRHLWGDWQGFEDLNGPHQAAQDQVLTLALFCLGSFQLFGIMGRHSPVEWSSLTALDPYYRQ
jgi:hypothetical protein